MTESDKKRLRETLCGGVDENSEHRYYVYALLDNGNIPFYIGKGQGNRVFEHEKEYENIKAEIEDAHKGELAELTEKLSRIEASGTVKKIIVKWGLTEHEAFMCESALINFYRFMSPNNDDDKELWQLTNAINGHASDLEKAAKGDNRARTIEEFLDECAIGSVDLSDIDDVLVIFVRINQLYKENMGDEISEITRGCWKIGEEIYNYITDKDYESSKPIYIAGLYNQVVKCIYKVKGIVGKRDFESRHIPRSEFIQQKDQEKKLTLQWLEFQSNSLEDFIRRIKEYKEQNSFEIEIPKDCSGNCDNCDCKNQSCYLRDGDNAEAHGKQQWYFGDSTAAKQFEQWKKRKYFIVDAAEDTISSRLLHKLITCDYDKTFLSSAQNSVCMNFEIKTSSKRGIRKREIKRKDKAYFIKHKEEKDKKAEERKNRKLNK